MDALVPTKLKRTACSGMEKRCTAGPGLVENKLPIPHGPSQNTNVYHMVVQCSQMFANIKHSIIVFNEHYFDVCEDSSKATLFFLWLTDVF